MRFNMKRYENGSYFIIENDQISFKLTDDESKLLRVKHENGLRIRDRLIFQQALNLVLGKDENIINERLKILVAELEEVVSEEHTDIPTKEKVNDRCREMYSVLLEAPDGLTDDEIQIRLERHLQLEPESLKNSIRYPRGILVKAGVIRSSGERRKTTRGGTAGAWIVVDRTLRVEHLPEEV